ncbi:tyrosine-protein phosphatase non-receptor type 2-like [Rhopilema esculentum]|uniref:tyrosine-protein phosphatase non-receptor type 2-like n=1 Tax=Rhopilema esculentum TaxID=499914 RepID=UPI0031DEAF42
MFLVEEVQKLDRSARWNYTFQVLNLETRKVVENFTLKAARQPEHRNLNRYRDVLPYDHSRVELEAGNTNYINGNLVEVC